MRVGQRALERVILPRQPRAKVVRGRLERLQSSWIKRQQAVLTAHELNRGALLRARLGEEQRAVRKFKCGKHHLAADSRLLAQIPPAQASSNHQVQYEKV